MIKPKTEKEAKWWVSIKEVEADDGITSLRGVVHFDHLSFFSFFFSLLRLLFQYFSLSLSLSKKNMHIRGDLASILLEKGKGEERQTVKKQREVGSWWFDSLSSGIVSMHEWLRLTYIFLVPFFFVYPPLVNNINSSGWICWIPFPLYKNQTLIKGDRLITPTLSFCYLLFFNTSLLSSFCYLFIYT